LLVPGGHSPSLSRIDMDADLARLYRGALRSFSGTLGWLMFDLGRQLGPRRVAELLRGEGDLDDGSLDYVLLSAERLTQMLAHLHIGRLLGQQARRWPERRPIAERFLRRTADVCAMNARRITRGDRDVLETIDTWRAAAAR
jgi:hypothetical protein